MLKYRILLNIAVLLCLFSGQIFAQEFTTDDDKVYISSDQLVCSDNGIFVLLESADRLLAKISVSQVQFDAYGLFVLNSNIPAPQAVMRCPKGHPCTCPKCFSCRVPSCPYRCRGH